MSLTVERVQKVIKSLTSALTLLWALQTCVAANSPVATCIGIGNNGFESGLSNWSVSGASLSTTSAYGARALSLSAGHTATQNVNITAGQNYLVSFYARRSAGGTGGSVGVRYLNSSGTVLVSSFNEVFTTDYEVYVLSTTAPASANRIQIFAEGPGTGTILIDEFCLSVGTTNCALLNNGGFESGKQPWGMGTEHLITINSDSKAGSRACLIGGTVDNGIWQAVPGAEGVTYVVSCWAKASASNASFGIRAIGEDWTFLGESWVDITSTGYERYSVSIHTPPGTKFIETGFWKNGATQLTVDEICMSSYSDGNYPEVGISGNVSNSNPGINTSINYTLNYNCPSLTNDCEDVKIMVQVPWELSYIGATGPAGSSISFNPVHNLLIVSFDQGGGNGLNSGSTGQIVLTAVTKSYLYNNQVVNLRGHISSSNYGTASTNLIPITINNPPPYVFTPGVDINKDQSGQTCPGRYVETWLTYGNTGTTSLNSFSVTDTFPTGWYLEDMYLNGFPGTSNDINIFYRSTTNSAWQPWPGNPRANSGNGTSVNKNELPAGTNITSIRLDYGTVAGGGLFWPNSGATLILSVPNNPALLGNHYTNCANVTAAGGFRDRSCTSTLVANPAGQLWCNIWPQGGNYVMPHNQPQKFYAEMVNPPNAGVALVDPVYAVLLPPGFVYVPGSQTFNNWNFTGTPPSPVFESIPDYQNTGRTLLRWKWLSSLGTGLSVPAVNFYPTLQVSFDAIPTQTGTFNFPVNVMPRNPTSFMWLPNPHTDTLDFDADGLFNDQIASNYFVATVIGASSSAGLESYKLVKGTLDADYSRYPNVGQTMPGGLADYKLVVKNPNGVPVTNVQLIDVLPRVGDVGVMTLANRQSQWQPNLAGPVAAPPGITVYYSTVTNPCRNEVAGINPTPFPSGCSAPDWSVTPPADITDVTALKFDFGTQVFQQNDSLVLTWPMRAPVSAPSAGQVAWNSFAFASVRQDNGNALLPTEPIKVGIAVNPLQIPLIGDFVWSDTDQDGIQDVGEPGIDGVRIELYQDDGDGVREPGTGDALVSFTVSANGGRYQFPDLNAGNYFLLFRNLPSGKKASINDAGADNLDSDGTPSPTIAGAYWTPVTNLGAAEIDQTWDLGLINCNYAVTANSNTSTICTGGTVDLSATESNGGGFYQWQQSADNSSWSNISGATNSSFTTSALTASTYFRLQVIPYGNCGTVNSNSIYVTVVADPSITAQPVSATICNGGTQTLSVTATGGTPSLTFQWQISSDNVTFSNIAGATDADYTTSALSATAFYRVIVTAAGAGCGAVTSSTATVTVVTDPTILSISASSTICNGGTQTLNVTASGGTPSLTYQWQSSSDNVTFNNIVGATVANYTTPALIANSYYRVLVGASGTGCSTFTSSAVTVTVVGDPTITVQPNPATVCNGGTQTLSVTATGGTPFLNYQWQSSADNTTFSDIPGATAASYATPALSGSTYYRVIISATGIGCGTVTSNSALVSVVSDPFITTQPVSVNICSGGTATLNVNASGGTPSLEYQWQISTDNVTFNNISGATSASFTTPVLTATRYYRVNVNASGFGCEGIVSSTATVRVFADPSITAQPVSATICNGGTRVLSVTATGGTPSLTYQWQSSSDNVIFSNIAGATAANYTTAALSTTTYYRVIVSAAGADCGSVTSSTATVTVVADPSITAQPVSASICNGGTQTLSVIATGGTPSLTYQWQSSSDNVSFTNITGATASNYSTTALSATTYYRVIVSAAGAGCGSVTSSAATVTVVADPSITAHPVAVTLCEGGINTFSVTASGGTPSLIYQWQSSTDNATYTDISGANNSSYTTPPLSTTMFYRVRISASGNGCATVTSNPARALVVSDVNITTHPSSATICRGAARTLSVNATVGQGTMTYQWQSSSDNVTFTNIIGATASTYTTNALLSTTYFRVIASASISDCGVATSNSATITVAANPIITSQPVSSVVCRYGVETFNVGASGGAFGLVYQWQNSTDSINFSNIGNGTTASFTTPPGQSTTIFYRVLVSYAGSGCEQVVSDIVKLSFVDNPSVATQPQPVTICNGASTTLNVTATGGLGTYTYQWQSSPDNVTYSNVAGAVSSSYTTPSLTATTFYRVLVGATGTGCLNTTSNPARVFITSDVSIISHPASTTICRGATRTLSVTSTGGQGTITYQWEVSTDNINFTSIPGATGTTYATPALTSTTYYRVVVSSSVADCGFATSNTATITVASNPVISSQPVSSNICRWGVETLNVVATGGAFPLVYQWQNSTDSLNFSDIGNGTSASFTTPGLGSSTFYRVKISYAGSGCEEVISDIVKVNVLSNPSIATHPQPVTICSGGSTNLTVTASGGVGSYTYQWQSSTDNVTFTNIAGASNSNYTTPALSNTQFYRVIVGATGTGCLNTTSNSARVFVVNDIVISTQPLSSSICNGGTQTLSVTATGGTPSLTYQWQSSSDNVTFTNITGATASNHTTSALSATTYYRVIISAGGQGCESATSNSATITVVPTPAITVQPVGATICSGGTHTMNVTATGGTPGLSYAWQRSVDSVNFNFLSGETGTTYTTAVLAVKAFYRVQITATGNGCNSVFSNIVSVPIVPDPTITTQPTSNTICNGGTHTLSVTATGGTPGLTFQWQSSSDNVSFTDIAGATAANYTTAALSATTYYRVIVSAAGDGCGSVTSSAATVTVVADPSITSQPTSASICNGGTQTLSVTATGGTPSLIYQWQSSSDNVTFTNIAGATAANYITAALSATTYYRVIVSAAGIDCGSLTSSTATITVVADPTITTQPISTTICNGGTRSLSVTAIGGTPGITYQWQRSTDNVTFSNISGATSSTYTTPALTTTTYYRVIVGASGAGCTAVTSGTATITVVPDPSIVAPPTSASICAGGTHTMSVTASGGTPSLTYQWQSSFDNITFSNIAGATSSTYTTAALSTTTYFRVIVAAAGAGCGSVTSGTAIVTVSAGPSIIAQPVGQTICANGTAFLEVQATGGTPGLNYQWQISTDNSVFTNIAGATSPFYNTPALSATRYFRVQITSSGSGCGNLNSQSAEVQVVASPQITTDPISATLCTNGTQTLSVTAIGGTPSLTYQWQRSTDNLSYTNVAGATNNSYTTPALTARTYYRVIVNATGNGCQQAISATSVLDVVAPPTISTHPISRTICSGGSVTLNVVASGGTPALTYQWQSSTDNVTFTNIVGATNSSFTSGPLSATTYYRVNVSASGSGCGTTTSTRATISILPNPAITTEPISATICNGGTHTMNIAATGGTPSLMYQWQSSADNITFANIAGATSANYTTSALISTTYYRAIVSASGVGCTSDTSIVATVTVNNDPVVTVSTNTDTVCVGGIPSLTSNVTGGTGTITYQWQGSADGITYIVLNGETNSTLNRPLFGDCYLRVMVYSTGVGCGDSVLSNSVFIKVLPVPVITVQPIANASICAGGTIDLVVVVTGGSQKTTYQWQQSSDNISFTNIPGANSSALTTHALSSDVYFRVLIDDPETGCGPTLVSTSTFVNVESGLTITHPPLSDTICTNQSASFSVAISGGAAPITYQWQSSTDNTTFSNIPGANSNSYNTPTLTQTTFYKVVVNTSAAGCSAAVSTTARIYIDDVPPILIGIPTDITVANAAAVPVPVIVTATDNVTSPVPVTYNQTRNDLSCGYELIRTWTATDGCGNVTTGTQKITVGDNAAPVLVGVPADVTVVNTAAIPAPATVTATDDLTSPVPLTYNQTRNDLSCGYELIRTWTATDGCGNVTTGSQKITVGDNAAPVLVGVPTDITVTNAAAVPAVATVTATDDLTSPVPVTYNQTRNDLSCGYELIRTWRATDGCGNVTTGSQKITVGDNAAPVLVGVPADVTVANAGAVPAVAIVTATDDLTSPVPVTYNQTRNDLSCGYELIRTWTATDGCGNVTTGSQKITVGDNAAPMLVGVPADVTVTNAGAIPAVATVTATDDLTSPVPVTYNQTRNDLSCGYELIRTWRATDGCGNVTTGSQKITVGDNAAPVLVGVPADITVVNTAAIPAQSTVTATDDLTSPVPVTYNQTRNDLSCGYELIRTWRATDGCGNVTTGSQKIIVGDNAAPVLVGVPADITVVNTAAIPAPATVTATDDLTSPVPVTYNQSRNDLSCGYELIRTWTAIDGCGNVTTGSQKITVGDNAAPVLVGVPADVTVTNAGAVPAVATVTATDDLTSPVPVTYNQTRNDLSCGYELIRTWTATDGCGNVTTGSQKITVGDNAAPVLVGVPADVTVVNTAAIPAPATVTATDDLTSPVPVTYNQTRNDLSCGYELIRTWTATDGCGNVTMASQLVTVGDNTAPILMGVPADITVDCDKIPAPATVSATDDLSTNLVVNYAETTANSGCNKTITRTWKVADACGNEAQATQLITTKDVVAPILIGVPADITIDLTVGEQIPSMPVIKASDNCTATSSLQVIASETINGSGCEYTVSRNFQVQDECGNNTVATQTITVFQGLVDATAASNSPICTGDQIQFMAEGGNSYQWTGPGGFTSNLQNPVISNASLRHAGTYYCVIEKNGCTAEIEVEVRVNQGLVIAINGKTTYCSGETMQLTVDGGSSWTWTGPNNFRATTSTITIPNIGANQAGLYQVTSMQGGCSARKGIDVVVNVLDLNITGQFNVCDAGNIQLTSVVTNPGNRPLSYSWKGPNGFSSANAHVNILNASTVQSGSYTLTVSNGLCTNTKAVNVTVGAKPNLELWSNSPVCQSDTIKLAVLHAKTASWTGPKTFVSDKVAPQIPNATVDRSGWYLVNYTDSSGCAANNKIFVTVGRKFAIDQQVEDADCTDGGIINLTINSGSGNYWFDWVDLPGANNQSNRAQLAPGNYQVVITDKDFGCVRSFDFDILNACTITGQTKVDTLWLTTFKNISLDGIQLDTSEVPGLRRSVQEIIGASNGSLGIPPAGNQLNYIPDFDFIGFDTAKVVLSDHLNNRDTFLLIIEVKDKFDGKVKMVNDDDVITRSNVPVTVNILENDLIMDGMSTPLIVSTGNGMTAQVNADRTLTIIFNAGYNGLDSITYEICYPGLGCDRAVVRVKLVENDLIVHQGFSPNNDGINDTFEVDNIERYPNNHLELYNRWGNLVYDKEGYKNTWDGTFNGIPLPDGTYFYVLNDGEGKILSGYVELRR